MDDEQAHGHPSAPGGATAPDDATAGAGAAGTDDADPLLAVRAALDEVDQLPLEERAEVFERTHRVVVDELRALELG